MKELVLIPELDACDFPHEVDEELVENDIGVHYESNGLHFDWEECEKEGRFKVTRKWLLDTYGEVVREHSSFSISPT